MRWTVRRHGPTSTTPTHPEPGSAAVPAVTLLHREPAPLGCRVVVVGSSWGLTSLSQHLPASWSVESVDEVGDLTVADLVVLTAPTAGKIAAIAARQPEAGVLALAHPSAEVDTVVGLLQHGATACVRTADVGLVAAHLIACARRYALGAG
jgi:hypothetical protein